MGSISVIFRIFGVFFALLAIIPSSDGALAAMSIDLGSQYIKIGLVKPGVPMEIVLNKESRRKTPNVLSIRNGERLFAEAAAALATKYPKSAYQYILSLIGKGNGHSAVQLFKQRFPFSSISFNETRETVVFPSEEESYNVETLLAMILWNARQTTEAFAGQRVKDVVITVPAFLNQAERRALTVAAEIAGLNLLQLLTDGSAAALNYGVFRRKEITETPQTMLIYDMGASKTTATLVEYVLESEGKNKKDKNPVVRTIGIGYDSTLGGLEMSLRLAKHLEKTFRDTVKTKTDVATNARSMAKIAKEAERVKQVLSANKQTYAQIENVHEDHNMRIHVTRDELEAMIKDLEPRIRQPITDALSMAEKDINQVDQIVMMGAGTRVPFVQEILKSAIGDKELGRFLNTDEAIALGAVYQAAHLSKSFKVLPFGIQELVLLPIQVNFKTKTDDGEKDTSRVLFGYKTNYPTSQKTINFQSYDKDFEISLNYSSLNHLSTQQLSDVGKTNLLSVSISGVEDAMKKEIIDEYSAFKGIKTSFIMDPSGILSVSKAHVVVERKPTAEELSAYEVQKTLYAEYEEKVKKQKEDLKKAEKERKKKKEEAEDKEDDLEEKEASEGDKAENKEKDKLDEDPQIPTPEPIKPVAKPVEPKTKTIKVALEFEIAKKDFSDLSTDDIVDAKKRLSDFEAAEKEKAAREAAMNALEAMVYDLPVKLEEGEEFEKFVSDEEKTKITEEVAKLRTWLEDDVSFETSTSEFVEHKKVLDDLVAPAEKRKNERLAARKVIEGLKSMLNHSEVFLKSALNLTTLEDSVFTEVELEVLVKLLTSTTEWWAEKEPLYENQVLSQDPVVTSQEIAEKIRDLDREVKYLLNKMKNFKPKPKKKANETEEVPEKNNDTTLDSELPKEDAATKNESEKKPEEKDHDPSEL